ncbi:MAG: hypothetical protein MZW92_50525 [Comamonadaceae bacterium]|nr:hypothetical protein [Comamonadaceae bacterium]
MSPSGCRGRGGECRGRWPESANFAALGRDFNPAAGTGPGRAATLPLRRRLAAADARRSGGGAATRSTDAPRTKASRRSARPVTLHVATRKGLWTLRATPRAAAGSSPVRSFLGHIVHHAGARSARRPHAARRGAAPATSGRRSSARPTAAARWKEARQPPAFAKARRRAAARVDHTFWLTPGPRDRAGRLVRRHLAAGPVPLRRRRRDLGSRSPASTSDPQYREWMGDGAGRHAGRRRSCTRSSSTRAMPRTCTSACPSGGVLRVDRRRRRPGGRSIAALEVVEGFRPDPTAEHGHDPHCVRLRPGNPDRLYQQNHCGIYRLDRPARRLGAHRHGDAEDGRRHRLPAGRCIRATPDTAWVFPMDGTDVWPRTSPGGTPGRLRARATAARTWQRQDDGPAGDAGVVDGQAPGHDAPTRGEPVGVYFGTTSGELWASRDEGADLAAASRATCPHIYAVEAA